MEVFLSNVPHNLTEDNLKRELTPFLKILGIVDWIVDKPKRKPLAWISFLKAADGIGFLKRHGKQVVPGQESALPDQHRTPSKKRPVSGVRTRAVARLHLLSTPIYAEKSNKKVSVLTLSHLRHERDERQKKPDKSQRASAISCDINGVSCGKIILGLPEMELKYVQQIQHHIGAYARFGHDSLTVHQENIARMDVPYNTIEALVLDHGSQSMSLILTVPPKFFALKVINDDGSKWERQLSFPFWRDHAKYVAHCLVYRLTVSGDYWAVIHALRGQDILSINHQSMPLILSPAPIVEDYATGMRAFEGKMQSFGNVRAGSIPFAILFQVQTLVWNNFLHPSGGLAVLQLLEKTARDPSWKGRTPPFTVEAMRRVIQRIPYPTPGTEAAALDPASLMDKAAEEDAHLRSQNPSRSGVYGPSLPPHQTWVFKATVTPARIYLQGPDAESRNRVLRMFPDRGDQFLRVSFCDEDGQRLALNPRVSNDIIYERFRAVLTKGIRIADRQYSFLGFSHSSLRSHATWFLALFVDADGRRQNRDTILAALGNFSDILIPAKCAARIGQAFSETPYAVDLFRTGIAVRWIPDVKSADGSRVFSDGVGTISWNALEDFWNALPKRSAGVTCFQIRWAGVKGLLVLDPRLQGKAICVRKESMMKFPSQDLQELGICDVASRPLRLVLNRQVIKILEDMGTSDSWFLALQNDALDFLQAVTATALNTSTFLQYQDIGSAIGLPSFIKQLHKMGIDYRHDAFLKSVVEHVVLRELRLLKHKARIPVPKGVTLFGVMDETGFLNEDEVYITFDATRGKSGERMDATLVDGPVIVTRSPALHPGDIQIARMVTPPDSHPLKSLRNCIAFSQRGSRDLPSQLSGGDLDGDLYNVIWDPKAFPKSKFEPADYTRVVPPSLDRPVTRDDIANFFIDFMRSDILGLIATRHQILADVQEDGTSDASCIKLAEMHSTAVDYSKTGIAVDWRDMPRAPRSRPDFLARAPPVFLYDLGQISHIAEDDDNDDGNDMGGAKPRYHRSEKILGRLYRGIDEKKIWSENIHKLMPNFGPSVWEQLLERVQAELNSRRINAYYESHSQQAWKIRRLYEDSMADNMWHFSENPRSHITEAEAFCGSILNKRGVQSRQQRETSMQLKEETDGVMTWISKLIRDGAGRAEEDYLYYSDESDEDDYSALRLSWACLVVGCADPGDGGRVSDRGTGDLESFRVVAAVCLLKELHDLRGPGFHDLRGPGLHDLRGPGLEERFQALDIGAPEQVGVVQTGFLEAFRVYK